MASVSRPTVDRNQRILLDLINKQAGNDICADCRAKGPRWASHNLGIFLCVHCAGIHRKIGTHITKVKSVTMDSWSKDQIEVMKTNGNIASNNKYNPNESRHPPPANREGLDKDSEMEKYIRAKYEFKQFMIKPQDQPFTAKAHFITHRPSPVPPTPPKEPSSQVQVHPTSPPPSQTIPSTAVWNDLMSLSNKSNQTMTPPFNVQTSTAFAVTNATAAGSNVPSSVWMSNPSGNPAGAVFTPSTSALSSQHMAQGRPISFAQQHSISVNPFTQPISTASRISALPQSSVYPQQILLEAQSHPSAPGTIQSLAPGVFQPHAFQQGPIAHQAYSQVPQGFALNSQQPPFPIQTVNDANYMQWQGAQTGFPPQYNQWS